MGDHGRGTPARSPRRASQRAAPGRTVKKGREEKQQRADAVQKAFRTGWMRDVKNAPSSLRSDKAFMADAVAKDHSLLEFASAELRADRDIVRSAVTQCRMYSPLACIMALQFQTD